MHKDNFKVGTVNGFDFTIRYLQKMPTDRPRYTTHEACDEQLANETMQSWGVVLFRPQSRFDPSSS